jgi:hypothetical protein
VTDVLCLACHNPSRDGGLCDACEERLVVILREVPRLLADLLVQTTRQAVTSTGSGRRGSDRPLPLDLKASELSSGLESLLASWAKAMGAGGDPVALNGGREAAYWLQRHLYDVRVHEAVGDLLDELDQHSRDCLRAIDRHGVDRVFLGICRATLPPNDVECMTALRAPKGARRMRCWRCSAEYDVAEMLTKRDDAIDGSLATVAEIAAAQFRTPDGRLITSHMVKGYAARGRIAAHGYRQNEALDRRAALYLIGEVKQAALEAKYPRARASA